jgi:hypothetical protein
MTTLAHASAALENALTDLAGTITGQVLRPGTDAYAAAATPWNVAATSAPIAVVTVADAADVVTAVRFADVHDLDVVVQSTGHGALSYTAGRSGPRCPCAGGRGLPGRSGRPSVVPPVT